MTKIVSYKIGSDPEVFLFDTKKKRYHSAIDLVGGTKDNPLLLSEDGHAIQEDNVAAEFNVPPSKDPVAFYKDIQFILKHIEDKVKKVNPDLTIAIDASARFEEEFLNHPKAKEFGCEVDFNAWTEDINQKPECEDKSLRSCGGHVHIGYLPEPKPSISIDIVRAFDLFLGVPSVLLDPDKDRRLLYGKAGCYRLKDYGVEYRTLSNFWIKSQELVSWVFNNVQLAVDFINSGNYISRYDEHLIVRCINNSDTELAKELIERFKIQMPIEEKVLSATASS